MSFKINISANIQKEIITKIIDKKLKLIRKNIITIIRDEALPSLITAIMVGYDGLSDIARSGPDDPTNPTLWRQQFLEKLQQDLVNNFIVTQDTILARIGDKDFLGYNSSGTVDPDDTEPLHWLVFYIEGLIGDWAFVTPEDYRKITGGKYNPKWGRFSKGFMISKQNYMDEGWNKIISFSQVRHPFSGFSPVDIFNEALNEFSIRPFIQKAIKTAVRGQTL